MANPISKLNLVINGVTTQLDIHDSNALTTEIDSMGEGWVRFKCGLQICYGIVSNNNGIATGVTRHSFPMAFIASPIVVTTTYLPAEYNVYVTTVAGISGTTFIINSWDVYNTPSTLTTNALSSNYVAIGEWK